MKKQRTKRFSIPYYKEGGSKNDWISKKIGVLIGEGYEKDQAATIAYSMYEKEKYAEGGEFGEIDPIKSKKRVLTKKDTMDLQKYSKAKIKQLEAQGYVKQKGFKKDEGYSNVHSENDAALKMLEADYTNKKRREILDEAGNRLQLPYDPSFYQKPNPNNPNQYFNQEGASGLGVVNPYANYLLFDRDINPNKKSEWINPKTGDGVEAYEYNFGSKYDPKPTVAKKASPPPTKRKQTYTPPKGMSPITAGYQYAEGGYFQNGGMNNPFTVMQLDAAGNPIGAPIIKPQELNFNNIPTDNLSMENPIANQVSNEWANQHKGEQDNFQFKTETNQFDSQNPYQFFNPYGGVDVPMAANYLGQSIEDEDTLGILSGGLKVASGIGRDIFAGIGQQRVANDSKKNYFENKLEKARGDFQPLYGEQRISGYNFQDGGEMPVEEQEASQEIQTDPQEQQEQIMQQVFQALQGGADPQQVLHQLIQMGVPQNQAEQLIQGVMQQIQGTEQEQSVEQSVMRNGGEFLNQLRGKKIIDYKLNEETGNYDVKFE